MTIFARNDQTYNGCGRRFVLSTNKTLKTFVKLLRGSFFKRSCEFFLYLKSFSKKIHGHGFESRWSPDFFFRLLLYNCLNWKIYCDDHFSLSSTTAVQKWIISNTSHHFTPHGRYELNKLTSLPMCGFIAQLVEQRTGNAEVTGSNPVEALIFFSGFFFTIA